MLKNQETKEWEAEVVMLKKKHKTEVKEIEKEAAKIKKDLEKMTKKNMQGVFFVADEIDPKTKKKKGMTRQQYRKFLVGAQGKEELEGQDVFHIIAESNGGANHPHNYLKTLSSSFNRSLGDKYDHFNCYLAGLLKTERAVTISKEIGNYKFQSSSKSDATVEAQYLVGRGTALMTRLRYLDKQ